MLNKKIIIKKLNSIVLLIILIFLGAYTSSYSQSTISQNELFDLRSKCHDLSVKLLNNSGQPQLNDPRFKNFWKNESSHFDTIKSRCYSKITHRWQNLNGVVVVNTTIQDAQTEKILVMFITEGSKVNNGHPDGHIFDPSFQGETNQGFTDAFNWAQKLMGDDY